MSKDITLDLEDVYYLLSLLPAMKDINDPTRYMRIIANVYDQVDETSYAASPKIAFAKATNLKDIFATTPNPCAALSLHPEFTYFKIPMEGTNLDNKIKAIKFVREVTGIGLKEAKDFLESDTHFHFNPEKWSVQSLIKKAEESGINLMFV